MTSCDNNTEDTEDEDYNEYYSEEDGYEDGTYCANVHYYNPNTGTNSDYTLEVEVSNNDLIQINFGNGGWLDGDHIEIQALDDNGHCVTYNDKGYEYEVQITGKDCGYTDEADLQRDMSADEESLTCPQCGSEKSEYDYYCDDCTQGKEDREENTCSRCGGYQYLVYGGICNNCKDDDEEEAEEEKRRREEEDY